MVTIHDSPHGRLHTLISYWSYTPALLKEIPAQCAKPSNTTLQFWRREALRSGELSCTAKKLQGLILFLWSTMTVKLHTLISAPIG